MSVGPNLNIVPIWCLCLIMGSKLFVFRNDFFRK